MTAPKKKPIPTPQQREAADPKLSAWVAANAGSGKTHVLVDRVIRLMLAGAAPQTILCLTFTKAAAAEMSNRLFERLGSWIALDDAELAAELAVLGEADVSNLQIAQARRLFARALETPGGLKIQTIHGFCTLLLQLFPVESRLAPGFTVMDGRQTAELQRQAFLEVLSAPENADDTAWAFLETSGITSLEALEDLAKPFFSGGSGVRQVFSDAAGVAALVNQVAEALGLSTDKSAEQLLQQLTDIDAAAYAAASKALSIFKTYRKHDVSKYLRQASEADLPELRLQQIKSLFFTKPDNASDDVTRRKEILLVDTKKSDPDTTDWLRMEGDRVESLFEKLALRQTFDATCSLYVIMLRVLSCIAAAKRRLGLYDFDDLITRAAGLLHSSRASQWVLYKLDQGISHVLVDEAQDTSPTQWKIIKALSDEFFVGEGVERAATRTIFAVGDRKQSIFSFQGADTKAFEAAHDSFAKSMNWGNGRLHDVDLTISYRSTPQVLQAVDTVFAPGSFARSGFGQNAEQERDHTAHRSKVTGVFEIWPLVTKDEETEPDHWAAPVDQAPYNAPRRKLARKIAKTVASWIGKRDIVALDRAVQPQDILILLQSRNLLFVSLISELRRLKVPVAGADRLQLHESLVVLDLLALGQFTRIPEDDHALACILKSPLLPEPVTEEMLTVLAYDRGEKSLWQRLQEHALQHANVKVLGTWAGNAAKLGPHDFFALVVQQAGQAILQRLGSEAQDAASNFLDMALRYEQANGPSLVGFLDWFQEAETEIKRDMEQASGEVRIMTVHGAKGLEAPIVFLADAADAPLKPQSGDLTVIPDGISGTGLPVFIPVVTVMPGVITSWKDLQKQQSMAERLRLLYVAMTRARDELYVCGILGGKKPSEDCWYNIIGKSFESKTAGAGLLREVIDDKGDITLRLGAEPCNSKAQPDQPLVGVEIPDWAKSALDAGTGSAFKSRVKPSRLARGDEELFDRAAARRGIAVHQLLEALAEADPPDRPGLAKRRGKALGLEDALVESLTKLVQQPELAVFFGPNSRSEAVVRGALAGIGEISGRLDRLAEVDGALYLLDYKSGRLPSEDLDPEHAYVKQMALYVGLLRQAYPQHSVTAALLWTQDGKLSLLPAGLLSQALERARSAFPPTIA